MRGAGVVLELTVVDREKGAEVRGVAQWPDARDECLNDFADDVRRRRHDDERLACQHELLSDEQEARQADRQVSVRSVDGEQQTQSVWT